MSSDVWHRFEYPINDIAYFFNYLFRRYISSHFCWYGRSIFCFCIVCSIATYEKKTLQIIYLHISILQIYKGISQEACTYIRGYQSVLSRRYIHSRFDSCENGMKHGRTIVVCATRESNRWKRSVRMARAINYCCKRGVSNGNGESYRISCALFTTRNEHCSRALRVRFMSRLSTQTMHPRALPFYIYDQ